MIKAHCDSIFAKLLEGVYEKLLQYRSVLLSTIGALQIGDSFEDAGSVKDVSEASSFFYRALSNYNGLLENINEVNNNTDLTDEQKEEELINLFIVNNKKMPSYGTYQRVLHEFYDLDKVLGKAIPQVIDW